MAQGRNNFDLRIFFVAMALFVLFSLTFVSADPVSPEGWDSISNTTKSAGSDLSVNITGGTIARFNLTATVQNPRWKAFVGEVIGKFTLDGGVGSSTIYDWSLSAVSGRVYASRSNAITWGSIACADNTELETENSEMAQSGVSDNITATFRKSTHDAFYVGSTSFSQDYCNYTLNTYNSTGVDQDVLFDEVALSDGSNIVYATLVSDDSVGFDGGNYDFQMIVPENGTEGYSSATPYYMYVEITN